MVGVEVFYYAKEVLWVVRLRVHQLQLTPECNLKRTFISLCWHLEESSECRCCHVSETVRYQADTGNQTPVRCCSCGTGEAAGTSWLKKEPNVFGKSLSDVKTWISADQSSADQRIELSTVRGGSRGKAHILFWLMTHPVWLVVFYQTCSVRNVSIQVPCILSHFP